MIRSRAHLILILIATTLAVWIFAAPAAAASARELIAAGNRAYAEENFSQAREAYDKAAVDLPESPQIYFNLGAVFYRQEDFAKAREHFQQAALKTRDLSLEARSKYNLGNCWYQEARRQTDSDLRQTLSSFEKSVDFYRQALKLEAEFRDAAHNLEIVRLRMKLLLDELNKQQEEAKKQAQKHRQVAKQLKQLIDEQKQLAGQSRMLSQQRGRQGNSRRLTQQSRQLAGKQRDLANRTRQLAQELQSPQSQPDPAKAQAAPEQQARKHLEQAAPAQNAATLSLQRALPGTARPRQDQAAAQMQKALDELNKGDTGQQQQQPGNEGQPEQKDQAAQQQPEDATQPAPDPDAGSRTARDILQDEQEQRRRRQRSRAGDFQPVDKDW